MDKKIIDSIKTKLDDLSINYLGVLLNNEIPENSQIIYNAIKHGLSHLDEILISQFQEDNLSYRLSLYKKNEEIFECIRISKLLDYYTCYWIHNEKVLFYSTVPSVWRNDHIQILKIMKENNYEYLDWESDKKILSTTTDKILFYEGQKNENKIFDLLFFSEDIGYDN